MGTKCSFATCPLSWNEVFLAFLNQSIHTLCWRDLWARAILQQHFGCQWHIPGYCMWPHTPIQPSSCQKSPVVLVSKHKWRGLQQLPKQHVIQRFSLSDLRDRKPAEERSLHLLSCGPTDLWYCINSYLCQVKFLTTCGDGFSQVRGWKAEEPLLCRNYSWKSFSSTSASHWSMLKSIPQECGTMGMLPRNWYFNSGVGLRRPLVMGFPFFLKVLELCLHQMIVFP